MPSRVITEAVPNGQAHAKKFRVTFDLSAAAEAARLEAEGEATIPVVYNGEKFEIPIVDDWTEDVFDQVAAGQVSGALRLIMGEEDYSRLQRAAGGSLRMRELRLLMEHVAQESGVESLGNSSVSTG